MKLPRLRALFPLLAAVFLLGTTCLHAAWTMPDVAEQKVIEDFPPIPGVKLEVRVPERVTRVRTISAGETLLFTQVAGVLTVGVPTFTVHTGIVVEYQTNR